MAAGVKLEKANVNADAAGVLSVDISAKVSAALIAKIEALGGTVIFSSKQYGTLRAKVKLSAVETIAGYDDVTFIQPAVGLGHNGPSGRNAHKPPLDERLGRVRRALGKELANGLRSGAAQTSRVDSEGDRAHRADDARNTYGYAGQGVRIGVLSDSFNKLGGAPADVLNGNLPGPGNPFGYTTPVTVVQEDPGVGEDEGRAMLEIVYDLAPQAQLFFATADSSEAGFATNITTLRNAPYNCDIIIDDVFYFDEPVFQDGIVAQAVNTVTAGGGWYFSSAGNQGSVAKGTAGYFEGDFNDTGSPAFTFPGGAKSGTIHNFGTVATPINGDIVTAADDLYTLNWANPQGGATDDYDLFLVSSSGAVRASSTNIQSGTQNPYESISPPTLVVGDRLVVFKTTASAARAFAINTLGGTLTFNTTGQTHGHATAADAFGVAATPAAAPFDISTPVGPFPNAFNATNQVEDFSSDGPRRVFFNADGSAITPGNLLFGSNGGTVRNKPDLTAADGVSTSLPSGKGLNPFYGTSAAAPHAGAIAALLKSANPALTLAQVRTILTSTALDIEGPGNDNNSGAGIVQAFQAMQMVKSDSICDGESGNGDLQGRGDLER